MLPFIPRSSRSFGRQGSYTPSRSITLASTSPHSSRRWCQSRPLRASRDASRHSTAPTSPAQSPATSRSKPGRAAGRTAEVVVDDLDLAEAAPPRRARTVGVGSRRSPGPGPALTAGRRRPPFGAAPPPEGDQARSSPRSPAVPAPAASSTSRASRATALPRSAGLSPWSLTASSARPSWRGTRDGFGGDGLILLLPNGVRAVRGASPETLRDEEQVQVGQRDERHPRGADRHAGAGDGIQHPGRHDRDHAGGSLDMDDLTRGAPLAVAARRSLY